MNKYNFTWLKESYVFYGVLLINLILISTIRFYPSMDGPAHLYNSNLICHLIKGDCSSLSDFFVLNRMPIPNWTSHFILSAFGYILPVWLADKILLYFYIIGLAISFRLLINKICPGNYLSVFIFPFTYSFLFHLGFYNYCLSFIFLFFTLYYWLKTKNEQSTKKYIILSLLIVLAYFSNVLTYCFLGLCLGLFILAFEITDYSEKRLILFSIKRTLKKLFQLFLISLPSLVLLIIFYKTTTFFPSESSNSVNELTKWINDVRALIVYDYLREEKITQQFFHIMIAIVSISVFLRFQNNNLKNFTKRINEFDIILIPVMIALILLYIIPNGSNAGMMSDRFCLMFFILLVIWVASQPLPKKVSQLFMILIIILHFALLFKHQNKTIKVLNNDALIIEEASKYIEPGTLVLPVNMTDNWLEVHFSNYLGLNKPIVILENYEAAVGWFPVKWNFNKLPEIMLGDKKSISGIQWITNPNSIKTKQIDYVFLYGNISKINDPKWEELKKTLLSHYRLIYTSNNRYIGLYKIRHLNND